MAERIGQYRAENGGIDHHHGPRHAGHAAGHQREDLAAFQPAERSEAQLGITTLRERVGALADATLESSADGLEALRRLGSTDIEPQMFDRVLRALGPDDVRRLRRYVDARVLLARTRRSATVTKVRVAGAAVWRALGGEGR